VDEKGEIRCSKKFRRFEAPRERAVCEKRRRRVAAGAAKNHMSCPHFVTYIGVREAEVFMPRREFFVSIIQKPGITFLRTSRVFPSTR